MSKAKMDSDGTYDTSYTNEMFCPYCGEEIPDAWEISKDNGSTECDHCEKEFEYERIVSADYTTRRKP
ncbi:MAG: hypothetical protein IT382_22810 [Deltaproteobacteria bacterium]|nr:hypothetical protein [Deltaproteobacteria bacterium]